MRKKAQENKEEIKINMQMANQAWNDWKFQIHCNKIDWVEPRSRDERKNPFCVYFFCLEDNNKTSHWVDHS